jgi:hypothetical protein
MIKKLIILVLSLFIISGCTSNTNEEEIKELTKYETLTIKTELLNKEADEGSYFVYLMPVGLRNEEVGKPTQSGFYGPFETDNNGEVFINLEYNNDLAWYIKNEENKKKNHLEVFITTKEDKYIRNPLNQKTEIKFIEGDTESFLAEYAFYSSVDEVKIPFTDKYPDDVLSLTFQDADFVIKFEFEEGFIPTNSYETSIFWNDPKMPDGIGIVRVGRINREFQYWDTPFYKSDNLASKTGTIIINHFNTDERIMYEGYPKTVSFDKDGNCIEGDIIKIKILKHD